MDIVNGYSNTFVSGTADNDYINNNRTSVTVDGGAGNLSTVNIGYDDDNSVSFVVADSKSNLPTGDVANYAVRNSYQYNQNFSVLFDLSTGTFQYDGLTLEGTGIAQINRHKAKLVSLTDGAIVSGNKFEMSAGKTFNLDEAGNISGIETAQSDSAVSAANVTEDLATINLLTTSGLDEVIGNFSEGLTVNGVFVRVTDSTNFVVKNDDENVYIVTTAPDTFTINGKTFTTSTDKTIFKLDKSGNVCEIVTDSFLIEGDFNDEIIFNGQKFCVTGTNDITVFIVEETLIGVELARNADGRQDENFRL